jgi:hypothetical protein
MKKLLALCLSIATLCISQPMTAISASYELPLDRACRFQFYDGHEDWSPDEVKRTITCAVRRWPVPGGRTKALAIAWRESRFQQYATNPSGCRGIYQWLDSTWAWVLPRFHKLYQFLSHNVYNARSNVMYAIRYAHQYGWGPWGG